MKMNLLKFAIFCSLAVLVSCSNDSKTNEMANKKVNKNEIKNEIIDEKFNSFSYRSTDILIDDLYQEIVDNNSNIKKLEEEINAIKTMPSTTEEAFFKYDKKSKFFYQAIEFHTENINDSSMKKKILELINSSKVKYQSKTSELNSLIKQISTNSASIDDHHNALKVVLTLSLIEKYQNENKPKTDDFHKLIKKQENLILKIDSALSKK